MRPLFTGVVRDWPCPNQVLPGDKPSQVMLRMSLKRHNDHFRGFEELNTDVNRIIFHALTVHVTVVLGLSTDAQYPFTPHVWTTLDVTCSDPNTLADLQYAVREAVARENTMMRTGTQWSPVFSACNDTPHIMMMTRLQRDIGAVLTL